MKLRFISLFLLFVSCKNDNDIIYEYMITNYNDIYQKEVIFSNNLHRINNKVELYDFSNNSFKLIFVGEMDCSPCVIKLKEIQAFLNKNKKFNPLQTIYIGVGETSEYFNYQVENGDFSFHIYSDEKSNFINKNKLFNFKKSTLLLDENNKIVFVGDLISNESLKKLYSNLIYENL